MNSASVVTEVIKECPKSFHGDETADKNGYSWVYGYQTKDGR